jgi:ribonuclease R
MKARTAPQSRGDKGSRDRGEAWEGALAVHPRGFGFVSSPGHEDVYVAPDGIGGAMHGDRVRVRVVARSSRGAEGRIDGIVKRRSPRIAGVLRKKQKSAWLEPDDSRIRGPIVFAKVPKDGRDGDAAVATITRFPDAVNENPDGELLSVLGVPGDPNVEVAKILVREQVEERHSEAAMAEAETMAARLARGEFANRRDFTTVPLLTIDPEDARDHDDAVFAERRNDGYRVWVAIADVSEYVQPGTALDKEALARGCTIYLPDRALPMLPAALAADVCSLLPDVERLCMCVVADIDSAGDVTGFEVSDGRMRAAAMLTYGGVARALGFTETPPKSPQAEALKRDLKVLEEVGRKLRKNRLKRGALDFDLPEPKIVLDEQTGKPLDVARRASDPGVKRAYQIIEELMILANELVAQWLGKRKSPAVYRVHAKPDEEKLERLAGVCKRLGAPFDVNDMADSKGVSRWLRRIAEHPRRAVLESMLLRSMKQAVYDTSNIGHFGLASTAYVHFTSPIRRYPDVQVHRAVKRLLRGAKPETTPAALELLSASATEASQRERAAMDVEREVVDVYRTLFMRDRIGEIAEGTVTALTGSGAFVTLDHPFVDVLVRYESMGPDRYELDEEELSATGARSGDQINIGDRMLVTIEDIALMRRMVFARRVLPEKLLKSLDQDGKRNRRGSNRPPRRDGGRQNDRGKWGRRPGRRRN